MKNYEQEERKCPVCKSTDWSDLIVSDSGLIMTGDQRIGPGHLHKIICNKCGVGANKHQFTETEIETLYGEEYELNTHGREEHIFFTSEGPISRSQVFANWIAPYLPTTESTLLEIGCGEGMLLSKIKEACPNLEVSGIDGSLRATKLAKKKGLNVSHGLIHGQHSPIQSADVIMLINVIEHVEDLEGVFSALKTALNQDGKLIFCLPIQDFEGYDIVFAEHIWHFTVKHFERLLALNGLQLESSESQHPINHGIGLFVSSKSDGVKIPEFQNQASILLDSWKKWNSMFAHVNSELQSIGDGTLAVFGSGEVLTLLLTYTDLAKRKIEFIIDETPSKIGTIKHDIPIYDLGHLITNPIENILITTNPKYFNIISKKVELYVKNVLSVSAN